MTPNNAFERPVRPWTSARGPRGTHFAPSARLNARRPAAQRERYATSVLLAGLAIGVPLSGCSTTAGSDARMSDIRDDQACISLLNGARQWHIDLKSLARPRRWQRIPSPPAVVEGKFNEELAFFVSLIHPSDAPYVRSAWFYSSKDETYGACLQSVEACITSSAPVWIFPVSGSAQWIIEGKRMRDDSWVALSGWSSNVTCENKEMAPSVSVQTPSDRISR